MSELNFKIVLEKEKVEVSQLPDKIQRKIAKYHKTESHPFSKNKKEPGKFTTTAQTELDDLNDDIVEGIIDYAEELRDNTEQQRLADEKKEQEAQAALAEQQRLADEKKEQEAQAALAEQQRLADEKKEQEAQADLAEQQRLADEKRIREGKRPFRAWGM